MSAPAWSPLRYCFLHRLGACVFSLEPLGGWCSVGNSWVRASRPALLTGQHHWLAATGGPLPVFSTSATVRLTHCPWLLVLWDTCTLYMQLCPALACPLLAFPCIVHTLMPTSFLIVLLLVGCLSSLGLAPCWPNASHRSLACGLPFFPRLSS